MHMNTYNQVRNVWGIPYQLSSMHPRTGSLTEAVSPSHMSGQQTS